MADRKELISSEFGLSQREKVVLRLLSEGHSNKAMARELDIQVSTVKAHVTNIMKLMGCRNRTQVALLGFCLERRLHEQAASLMTKMALKPVPRPPTLSRESLAG